MSLDLFALVEETHKESEDDKRDYREEHSYGDCVPMGDGIDQNRKPHSYEDDTNAQFPCLDQLCASFAQPFP